MPLPAGRGRRSRHRPRHGRHIFQTSGSGTWCPPNLAALLARPRRFDHVSKASAAVQRAFPGIQEAVGGPLTDQNGRFVRYQIVVNQDEFNYIQTNNLWNAAGQAGKTISFPSGPQDLVCNGQSCGPTACSRARCGRTTS